MNAIKEVVIKAQNFRFATKEFDKTKKISEEDFQYILENARLSPSSIGLEPWKFLVIQDEELRSKIREVSWGAQGQLPTASHFVLILARTKATYDADFVKKHMEEVKKMPPEFAESLLGRYKDFQEEFGLLDNEKALFDWSSKQTYIALANMMTSAALIGIDSCPIEGFDPAAVNKILEERNLLENGEFAISVMAAFGYRAADPSRPKTRSEMKDIVEWI
ncbi:NAD(P)H-dependent oxidoreductase [Peribacillus kribbensis]|uniref:NAD(P)H-dependent oxidoreductase n=1 Tax=Peribacillus kribbensis TaxID=356658 RepID=UPI0004786DB8|nr:NAD(P)H-dependent oxidoreductase [Peribacillus kribbensis]